MLPPNVGRARRIIAPHRARGLCRGTVLSSPVSSVMMGSEVEDSMTDAMMVSCSTVAMEM